MYTIEDLAQGKCAVINDGALEELNNVLDLAFSTDVYVAKGVYKYYFKSRYNNGWKCDDNSSLPKQSVKDFLKPQLKRGDLVYASDDKDNMGITQKIYLETIKGSIYPIITVAVGNANENRFNNNEPFKVSLWKYFKPVPKNTLVHLTLQDISDGKGVGVDSKLIRIKE